MHRPKRPMRLKLPLWLQHCRRTKTGEERSTANPRHHTFHSIVSDVGYLAGETTLSHSHSGCDQQPNKNKRTAIRGLWSRGPGDNTEILHVVQNDGLEWALGKNRCKGGVRLPMRVLRFPCDSPRRNGAALRQAPQGWPTPQHRSPWPG
jgi:hypothetical protein